ncbi:hypothetical protein BRC81_15350 [Halobacteriales archaeon QS_1_68_20]|nr:MAG: hypothetical protein BRC81_15350 [Halobacteriales archaeon QS_1_68_20]
MIVAGVSVPVVNSDGGERAAQSPELVSVTDETELWPYTSQKLGFEGRTLAINVVVYGDPATVQQHLKESSGGNWSEVTGNETDVDPVEGPANGTTTRWDVAGGATRYVYVVDPVRDSGAWLTESYQLHDGDYLGTRHHIRAYEAPREDEQWVAMQTHHEHWDWFRLRHTVDGTRDSQSRLEREFMDRPFVEDLSRTYVGNAKGSDADGWVTVIRLRSFGATALLAILAVPVLGRKRPTLDRDQVRWLRRGLLAGGLGGLYLGVRFGGIVAERLLPGVDPLTIAAVFYPVLFVGLPVWAFLFARKLSDGGAAVAAMSGFTGAVLVDYTYLQVQVLPLDTLVHRLALVVALGLVAVGGARMEWQDPDAGRWLRAGVLLWLLALGLPMLRFV